MEAAGERGIHWPTAQSVTPWALLTRLPRTWYLTEHFQQWRREGRGGVWLHLPLPLAHLANEAVAAGFRLHHTSNEEMSIVLCAWLEDSTSRLPRYASHHVGVSGEPHSLPSQTHTHIFSAGVVYRQDTQQILVVQDKYKVHV